MTPITALGSRYGIQGALGRSVKRAAAGGGWWDLNGTITSCVVAYQPKGAADLAASYVNLANPGTYNASVARSAPAFDTNTGWYFGGKVSNSLLSTNYTIDSSTQAYSALFRFSDGGAGSSYEGTQFGTTSIIWQANYKNAGIYVKNALGGYKWGTYYTGGVLGMAGANFYVNGSLVKTVVSGSGSGTSILFIGNTVNDPTRIVIAKVQAFSFYNAALTAAEIAAVSTAMAAL